jgi:uncharacterized protein YecE (DUF72 family)
MKKTGRIWIGTSNATVPGNKTTFPPAFQNKSRLHYYSTIFNTVEVNSCFYKTPQLSTYERWSADTPDDFQFSLKLSKAVTHVKDLESDLSCIANFMQNGGGIGAKKGCILVQLPGKISLEHFTNLEEILQTLRENDPEKYWKLAVEFRNPTWYTGETNELLQQFHATRVLHDHPKGKNMEPDDKALFIYLRFHGPTGNYRGSYSESFLNRKTVQIKEWSDEGKDVYVYFNNTAGDAYNNAVLLNELLK